MAELVAFEDSPLGQYLQEVGSAEALIADDKADFSSALYEEHTADISNQQIGVSRTWTDSLRQHIRALARLVFGESTSREESATIASLTWSKLVDLLADSGHMADKYTPKKTHILSNPSDGSLHAININRTGVLRGATMRIVPMPVIGGVLLAQRRYPNSYISISGKIPIMVAAGMFALMGAVAARSLFRDISTTRALRRANAYINELHAMLFHSRMLDNSLHRELCFVQEMDLITRGFRLPVSNAPLQLSQHRPGRGTLFAAQHMRQKIGLVLFQNIKTLTDIALDTNIADECSNSGLYKELRDAFAECMVLIEYYQDPECVLSLEYLRQAFAAQFTLRRLWLEYILACFRIAAYSDNNSQTQLLGLLQSTSKHIQRLHTAATSGLDELKAVKEAQYAATRWKAFAEPQPNVSHGSQPLMRSLTNMADALTTLQAKVLICQECIYVADDNATQTPGTLAEAKLDNERSPEDVARLFASLKSDIDMLGTHYQEAITRLLCSDDAEENVFGNDSDTVDIDSRAGALEVNADDVPKDVRVFGYTSLSADGLDAPEMTFEANVEANQHVTARKEADKERKGNVTTMMLELRSAIGSRTKGNTDSVTNEDGSDNHLDDDEDIERTK
ncbi:hypothetical protein H4R20_000970 [Coemansia guatemalensis]|uniref:Myosin-binding domain-containing protein n=1 Tax=Coemansia guatemalensis TaxID=2761395 RepID=A0A9W8LUY6_9FUNG|nr:hypothetical protein H4R20_000970 [Coemansia guatemalensis]